MAAPWAPYRFTGYSLNWERGRSQNLRRAPDRATRLLGDPAGPRVDLLGGPLGGPRELPCPHRGLRLLVGLAACSRCGRLGVASHVVLLADVGLVPSRLASASPDTPDVGTAELGARTQCYLSAMWHFRTEGRAKLRARPTRLGDDATLDLGGGLDDLAGAAACMHVSRQKVETDPHRLCLLFGAQQMGGVKQGVWQSLFESRAADITSLRSARLTACFALWSIPPRFTA